jgi:hypothetical protein
MEFFVKILIFWHQCSWKSLVNASILFVQFLCSSTETAVDNDGALDKKSTYNDIFDAFRLAMKFYHFEDSSEYG